MKIKWKTLLICVSVPLIAGGVAGFVSRDSMRVFEELNKPPLSPPGWLFPVVWTILYLLMGISSYLILTSRAPQRELSKALRRYGLQLAFNILWPFWFFNLQRYTFSFFWLVVLWILILATIISFARISKPAAFLMLPYLLWVSFAGYLNLGIAMLN